MIKSNINSRVMHMAHALKSNEHNIKLPTIEQQAKGWSGCVKKAWLLKRFKEALCDGMVEFTYVKKDGSIRRARGTLNGGLIPYEDAPKDMLQGRGPGWSVISYYDIDKKAWRAFCISGFIEVHNAYKLTD